MIPQCHPRARAAIVGLVVMLLSAAAWASTGGGPQRILFLHSFEQGTSPFGPFNAPFRAQILRAWPASAAFYDVALEGWRPGVQVNEGALVGVIRSRFSEQPMDLIVAVGARAAQFYVRHRDALFPGVPLLLLGDERGSPLSQMRPGDAFVGIKATGGLVLDGILELLPDTRSVAVVMGDSPIERFWIDVLKKEFEPYRSRVDIVFLNTLSLPQMRERVSRLPEGTVVLFGLLLVDAAGIPYQENYALSELRAASSVPIFSFFESELGRGIVGGRLFPNAELGNVAAVVANRQLRGEPLERALTYVDAGPPRYDWRELDRWGIDAGKLPRRSEVLFRPPTLWEEHRTIVLAALAVVLLQMGMIAALLAQRTRRRHAERETSALSWRLLTVHEDERRRLARELHDDVTQRLARLAIDAARSERARDPPAQPGAPSIHNDLVRLSDDVHALSYRLHPAILDDLGLEAALKAECEQVTRQDGLPIDVRVEALPGRPAPEVSLCIFRVAQEALRNVARHAKAAQATVSLRSVGRGLELVVGDDGVGFDVAAARTAPSLGHASMEERIKLLGGRLVIRSRPGQGTTITAWVPLAADGLGRAP